jgi:hypothetical protein
MQPFEARFAERARAYTDVAIARRIDALEVSRTAMSSQRAAGWSKGRLSTGLLGRRIAGMGWAAAVAVVVLIGALAIAVLRPPSDASIARPSKPVTMPTPSAAASAGGPIPDVLRHSWQRPSAVTPGLDQWGSGFLSLATGMLEFGPQPGPAASRSAISASGVDTLAVTATVETFGCATGDLGAYRWSVEGKDTVMVLTAIGTDACAAREAALAGSWLRTDFPTGLGDIPLLPGTYETSGFDPFGDPVLSGQLSYTVPAGWKAQVDEPATFVLQHLGDPSQSQPPNYWFIFVIAQPRMAAEIENGARCDEFLDAPGVGRGVDDIVAAIRTRAGVVSTAPTVVPIGGYSGQLLDLSLAPRWTGGCRASAGGTVVGIPILYGSGYGTGPSVGISPDHPARIILLELGDGRTMAVVISCIESLSPSSFDQRVAEGMPIIESFEFHPPPP